MILKNLGCIYVSALHLLLVIIGESNGKLISNKLNYDVSKIIEFLSVDANILLHNISSLPLSGSFQLLSSPLNDHRKFTLLTVYNSETGVPLGKCDINVIHDEMEMNWQQFDWLIDKETLRCYISGKESTSFKITTYDTMITLQIGNGTPNFCIKNLSFSDTIYSAVCPLQPPFRSVDVQCGCSLLTTYSAQYDSPFPNEDEVLLSDEAIIQRPNTTNLNISSLPDLIAFPLFRSITPNSNSNSSSIHIKKFGSSALKLKNTDDFSDQVSTIPPIFAEETELIFSGISVSPQMSAISTLQSVTTDSQFTLSPEIWVHAIRPQVRPNITIKNSSLPIEFQSVKPQLFPSTNITQITDNGRQLINEMRCNPICEVGGRCVPQTTKKNTTIYTCSCPDGQLGLNCNIKNPCTNATKCMHYGGEARCVIEEDKISLKAPLKFVEAPHICLCQDDNSDLDYLEWNNCEELLKSEFHSEIIDKLNSRNNRFSTIPTTTTRSPNIMEIEKATNDLFLAKDKSSNVFTINTNSNHFSTVMPNDFFMLTKENLLRFSSLEPNILSENSNTDNDTNPPFPIHKFFNSSSIDVMKLSETEEKTRTKTRTQNVVESDLMPIAFTTLVPHFSVTSIPLNQSAFTTDFQTINGSGNFDPLIGQSFEERTHDDQATTLFIGDPENIEEFNGPSFPVQTMETTNLITKIYLASSSLSPFTTTTERSTKVHHLFKEIDGEDLEQKRTNEFEGDNGFEHVTQLISELPTSTMIPPQVTTSVDEKKELSNFGHYNTSTNELAVPFENSKKKLIESNQHGVSVLATSTNSPSGILHENDAVSWIIAIGVLGAFLMTVLTGVVCISRYVRQSRRLHGKYNPAREENAIAATYAMPMTTVSKEERLI